MSWLKIGIIGAGRVGCALAIGLKEKGFEIAGIYSRSGNSVEYLNSRLGINVINDIFPTVQNSDAIFITVPDGQINGVAEKININIRDVRGKIFLHCSGASTSDELALLHDAGAHIGSLHPIQTFADSENGWKGLDNIYFGFEGSEKSLIFARVIVNAFNSKLLIIDKENKTLYHAAASMLSNYTVTLSYIAGKLLGKAGIETAAGMEAFMPLMKRTVENITASGSAAALTGPISRGDVKTVEAHIIKIKEETPELLEVYKALGRKTIEIAALKGSITSEYAEKLKDLFKD